MTDHSAEMFLSKTVPVDSMSGCRLEKETVISEVVALRALWEDEERAPSRRQIEFVAQPPHWQLSTDRVTLAQLLFQWWSAHPSVSLGGSTVLTVVTEEVEMIRPGFSTLGMILISSSRNSTCLKLSGTPVARWKGCSRGRHMLKKTSKPPSSGTTTPTSPILRPSGRDSRSW